MNSPAKSTVFPPDIVKSVPDNDSDCESLSRLGGNVTGIDFVKKNIEVAKYHSIKKKLKIIYKHEDIENATIGDVQNFFTQWYPPNNASLVVCGDFDPAVAKDLIQKYYVRN